jgi:hypothetical protein
VDPEAAILIAALELLEEWQEYSAESISLNSPQQQHKKSSISINAAVEVL